MNKIFCLIYDIAVLAEVTDPCKPRNFRELRCLLEQIKDALTE